MDKWEKLKQILKEEVENSSKMSYYEYMYTHHSGAEDILKMMEEIEKEK